MSFVELSGIVGWSPFIRWIQQTWFSCSQTSIWEQENPNSARCQRQAGLRVYTDNDNDNDNDNPMVLIFLLALLFPPASTKTQEQQK